MFKPTHVLTIDGASFDVCVIDGVYYTKDEIESETRASYEIDDGVLTCNGTPCREWRIREIKSQHFESWYKVARGLSHGWATYIEEAVSAEAYTKNGWRAVGEIFAVAQLDARFSLGIAPPPHEMHEHVTGSGRLRVSVDAYGDVKVIISRPGGDILGVRYDSQGAILQSWKIGDEPVFARHINAATEIAHVLGGEIAGLLASAELCQHHVEKRAVICAQGCRILHDPHELLAYPTLREQLSWTDTSGDEATTDRLLFRAEQLDRAVSYLAVTDIYAVDNHGNVIMFGEKLPSGSIRFSGGDEKPQLTEFCYSKCVTYGLPEGTKEIRRLGFVLQFRPDGSAEFINLCQVTAKEYWYSRRANRIEIALMHKGDYRIQAITWTPSNGQRVADLPVVESCHTYDSVAVSVGGLEYYTHNV